LGSENPASSLRRLLEAARNAAIAAIVLGGLTQLVFRNTIVTGIVGWVVFLPSWWGRGCSSTVETAADGPCLDIRMTRILLPDQDRSTKT